jgi:hydrogenase maturation protease
LEKVLVMGVGNVLLSDEGLGVHAINYMKDRYLPEYLEILDGGTGGFHLLSLMFEYNKMILIDAALDDSPTGTVREIKPRFSKDFPKALTTHDIGLKDLLDTATALGKMPEIYLIAVSIDPQQEIGMTLSPPIEKTLQDIYFRVLKLGQYMTATTN